MEKYNNLLRNIAKIVEVGLISSRDIKKEVENRIESAQKEVEDLKERLKIIAQH